MKNGKTAGGLCIVGGAIAVAGVYLPWAKMSISGIAQMAGTSSSESITGSGTSDGNVILAAGVLVALMGIAALGGKAARTVGVLVILFGLVVGGIGIYDAGKAKNLVGDELEGQIKAEVVSQAGGSLTPEQETQVDSLITQVMAGMKVSVGTGLYAVIFAGVLMLVGGGMSLTGGRSSEIPSMAPPMPVSDMPATSGWMPPAEPADPGSPPPIPPSPPQSGAPPT